MASDSHSDSEAKPRLPSDSPPEKPGRAEISLYDAEPQPPHHAAISLPVQPDEANAPTCEDPAADTKRSAAASRIQPGTRLLNRFRVLRYVARGGMGEVYEVEDEITGRTMALKTVVPEVSRDPLMVEQLKQEINNARDVTHPNVCRVFEVFEDTSQPIPAYFLTMEFLQGETLADILRHRGPMSPQELLPAAVQMAAGLAAVHKAGIVHQDFKTSNVMRLERDGEQRLVVTDFGLAVNLRARERQGMGGGTPAYMAPEQVEAKESIDRRADIYAFGVVLYELLTARFPIEGKTAAEVMQAKLHQAAVPPSRYREKIPAHWEKTILRCLERDPAARFQSVDEVIAALEQRAERRRRRRTILATAALFLVALAGIGGGVVRRLMTIYRTPTLAVVGMANDGSESAAWLGTELAEALSSNLASSKDLKIVPQDDVNLIRGEFPSASPGPSLGREDLSGFRVAAGADYLVVGRYRLDNAGRLTLEFQLQGPKGERVGSAIHEQGPEQDYQAMVAKAADRLRGILGSSLLPEAEAEEAANLYPRDQAARRLYFDALTKLRAMNGAVALQSLNDAARVDDRNVAIHLAKADALLLLKRFGEARLEAQRAQELTNGAQLPNEYVMLVQVRASELSNDWPAALRRLQGLYELSRDKLHYGLLLAHADVQSMHAADAQQVLGDLSKLSKPSGDDPRIAITQAEAFSLSGDYAHEIQAAKQARQAAQQRKWRLMEARADLELCWAQQRADNSSPAPAACGDAETIFSSVGDPVNAAVVLNNIANWQLSRGNLAQARQAYQDVLVATTKAEDQVDAAGAHLNLASTLLQMGDLTACGEHVQAALAIADKTGDKYDESRARLILADLDRATVGIQPAIVEAERAKDVAVAMNDRDTEAYAWTNLVLYLKDAGKPAEALEAGERALQLRRDLKDPAGVAAVQEFMADVYREQGELTRARDLYAQALAAHGPDEKPKLAELWLSQAQVDLDLGKLDSAEQESRQAADEYQHEGDKDSEADALSLLVQVALARHEPETAKGFLQQIDALSPQDKEVLADVQEARARWLMAGGRANDAVSLLTAARNSNDNDNKDAALSYSTLEHQLTLAQARYASHQTAQALREFAKIRTDARNAGYKLLASRANPPSAP